MNKKVKVKVNLNLYDKKLKDIFDKFSKHTSATIGNYNSDLYNFQVIRVIPEYIGNLCIAGDRSKQVSKLATCNVEGRKFKITVHEKSNVNQIIKLIETERNLQASLGSEKNIIECTIPDPTTQRREQVIKEMKVHTENYKTQIQNLRRDMFSDLDKQKKAKTITDDEYKKAKEILEILKDNALCDIEDAFTKQENDIRKAVK